MLPKSLQYILKYKMIILWLIFRNSVTHFYHFIITPGTALAEYKITLHQEQGIALEQLHTKVAFRDLRPKFYPLLGERIAYPTLMELGHFFIKLIWLPKLMIFSKSLQTRFDYDRTLGRGAEFLLGPIPQLFDC